MLSALGKAIAHLLYWTDIVSLSMTEPVVMSDRYRSPKDQWPLNGGSLL